MGPSHAADRMGPVGDEDRWLLVLGAGPGQLGVLETARALGIRTAVCDRDPARARASRSRAGAASSATDDEPAIERLGGALAARRGDRARLQPRGRGAARIAEKLGLAHPLSAATALVATSKLRQREALAAAGVPQPRWQVAHSAATSSSRRPWS